MGSPGFNPEDLQVDDWLKGLLGQVLTDGRSASDVMQDPDTMGVSDAWETGIFDWGKVPSNRLIYAHEALRKLVSLLDAEKMEPVT